MALGQHTAPDLPFLERPFCMALDEFQPHDTVK